MVMPLAGRVVFAVIGGLLVLTSVSSVTGTLIVTRSVSNWLTRWVDRSVDWAYQLVVGRLADVQGDSEGHRQLAYLRRDRLLATQAAAILLTQLATWLIVAYVGFALLLWPFAAHGVISAFIDAGSSLFTLGFAVPVGAVPAGLRCGAAKYPLTKSCALPVPARVGWDIYTDNRMVPLDRGRSTIIPCHASFP